MSSRKFKIGDQRARLDDDEVLDDLLVYAKVKRTRRARHDLLLALHYARNAMPSEQAVPAELLKKLALSIEKTSGLLSESHRYNTTIGYQVHTIGVGVVDVIPSLKVVPLVPIEGIAGIRLQPLLNAWHHSITLGPRRKPVRPKAESKAAIVRVAIEFFSRHSARNPSTAPNNPLFEFVQEFYKYVIGTKPDSSLEHQIKQALRDAKSPSGTP
jgi:hypothetical protein